MIKFLLIKLNSKNIFIKLLRNLIIILNFVFISCFFICPFLGNCTNAKNILAVIWYISCVFAINYIVEEFINYKKKGKMTDALMYIPVVTFFVFVFIKYYYMPMPFLIIILGYFAFAIIQEIIFLIFKGKFISWPLNKLPSVKEKLKATYIGGMIYLLCIIAFIISIYFKILFFELTIAIIILLLLIASIANTIPNWGEKHKLGIISRFFTILDFSSAFALIVYIIFLINNDSLQKIVLTITAATIGGLLTLGGVAWTIKRQDNLKKEENRLKVKPLICMLTNWSNWGDDEVQISNEPKFKTYSFFIEKRCSQISTTISEKIYFKNFDLNILKIKEILVNNYTCISLYDIYINKGQEFGITFEHPIDLNYSKANIIIVISDIYDRKYFYKVIFKDFMIMGIKEIDDPNIKLPFSS